MIPLKDRQTFAQNIRQAQAAGARLHTACTLAGIDSRTLQRCERDSGLTHGDRRPEAVRKTPAHALSATERARILAVANEPRFAQMPPARIRRCCGGTLYRCAVSLDFAKASIKPLVIIAAFCFRGDTNREKITNLATKR
jgi:hypothetical protein